MNRGCLHGIIKKRSDSLNLLFKDALVDYATKLWKYDIITDALRENVLDPGKGGKEERASSLFTALYNAVKVADLANQTVHMIHLVEILEDVSGAQIGAVLRKDLADFDIHITLKRPVLVSDHKGYHSEPACVNESQMGMVEEQDDRELCQRVRRILHSVLKIYYHRLLIGDSILADFASKMFEKGLISKAVKSGSFDEIMADFQACWEFANLKKLEEQCLDFLDILKDLGGPSRMAADVLEKDWNENVEKEIKETFLRRKRFQKSQSTPENHSKKPVIKRNVYSETDLPHLSIDNQQIDNGSQHVLDANGSIHGRKSLDSVPEETDSKYTDDYYCETGEEAQDLESNGSPHFTTSSARPMNNDPNNPLVPGRNQKQSLTLSFSQTHHEDSGVPHTSQTISASSLSTLQSPTAPESHTPYQEESLDQTRDLSGTGKTFVAPTQATHIRQSQLGPSDTAYLQSQPFSSTHPLDLFIQSLMEDKKKLEEEKTEAITILRKKYEQDIIELKQRVKEHEQKRESERKQFEFDRRNLEKHKEEQEKKLNEQQEKQDLREESLKEKDDDLHSQILQLRVDQKEFNAQKNELSKQKKNAEDREEKLKETEQRERLVLSQEKQLEADKRNFRKQKKEENRKLLEQKIHLEEENRKLVQQKTKMTEEQKEMKEERKDHRDELQNNIKTRQNRLNQQDKKSQKRERNSKIMFVIASLLLFVSFTLLLKPNFLLLISEMILYFYNYD